MDRPVDAARPILVVEDNELIRQALEVALQSYKLPVVLAANGRQGLESLDKQQPSLVLLNMHMPELDGWGFHRELQARGTDPPPVVVMSGAADAPGLANELGAVGSLEKPFGITDLLKCVRQYRR